MRRSARLTATTDRATGVRHQGQLMLRGGQIDTNNQAGDGCDKQAPGPALRTRQWHISRRNPGQRGISLPLLTYYALDAAPHPVEFPISLVLRFCYVD